MNQFSPYESMFDQYPEDTCYTDSEIVVPHDSDLEAEDEIYTEDKQHMHKALGALSAFGLLRGFDAELRFLTPNELGQEHADSRSEYRTLIKQISDFCIVTSDSYVEDCSREEVIEAIEWIAEESGDSDTQDKSNQWLEAARTLGAID